MEKTNIEYSTKKITIRINSIDCRGSVADGPGIRSVVYFQGCKKRCKACHNKSTWDLNAGKNISIEEIINTLLKNTPTKRVTISGGEPLLQKDGLISLLINLKKNGFNIAVYTGLEIQDVPKELFDYIDYLKYGEYIDEKRITTKYYGSSNQKFIEIKR